MGALRKHGIRWMIDLMSSDNAALGSEYPHRWAEKRGMLLRVFVEPAAFAHWQALASKLLTTRNPYTGLAPAQDPSTAALILINEDPINIQAVIGDAKHKGRFPDLLRAPYVAWLKERGSYAAAAQLPALDADGPAMEQFQKFLTELQIETSARMRASVEAMG